MWTFIYKFLYGNMFWFFFSMYREMKFLGHMATLCLTLWKTGKMFSKAAMPLYIPTSNIWVFVSLHFHQRWLLSVNLFIAILVGVWWFLLLVLTCVSLMVNDLRAFVCLLAICLFLLEIYLFSDLLIFLNWFICVFVI